MKSGLRQHLSIFLLLAFLGSRTAEAYRVNPGDWLLRPVTGWNLNAVGFEMEQSGAKSPTSGMLLGLDAEYAANRHWGIVTGLRPVLAAGYLDLGLLSNARYRPATWQAPFVPYVDMGLVLAFVIPLEENSARYTNLGLRTGLGFDYFVLHDLALGMFVATEPVMAFAENKIHFELAVELGLGLTFRL